MRVSKITIGRLYNLGSYEHVRYEIAVDIAAGESPATALLGLEKILTALNPKTSTKSRDELERDLRRLEEMKVRLKLPEEEFRQKCGYFVGTPAEFVQRCEESYKQDLERREQWESRSTKARKMLEDIGGAANWKDAKLDWETDFDNDL